MSDEETTPVTYEELAQLEEEFDQVEVEIVRQQYELTKDLYAKRSATVAKIPNFWPLVLEQSPYVDQYIQPNDARIIAESLTSIDVSRHELDDNGAGSPRSFTITMRFAPNADFADGELTKKFWYRRARDGHTGLVSEPVKIHWKKGKDLTEGLTDGAVALWEARRARGDMMARDVAEYAALKETVEHWNAASTSFFTWFGWVSTRRWVSAEESAAAEAAHARLREARRRGEPGDAPEQDDAANDDSDVEVHEQGEEVAISFAEEVWPGATKLFIQAQEADDMSDVDFEDMEDDDEDEDVEDDDEDEDVDEDEDDAPVDVDIQALIGGAKKGGKRSSDGGPPAKKQKK